MIRLPRISSLATALIAATWLGASASALDVEDTISDARGYIVSGGKESVLDDIKSLRFVGVFTDGTSGRKGQIELFLQKPLFQLSVQKVVQEADGKTREIETRQGLDDYECWNAMEVVGQPATRRLQISNAEETALIRANAWEYLNFFKGIEQRGGRAIDRGAEQVDGVDCHKIEFRHSPDISYTRYFDRKTGKLILTLNPSGASIREEGEIKVNFNGVTLRFPKRLNMTTKGVEGTSTLVFDQVVVNEPYERSKFQSPDL